MRPHGREHGNSRRYASDGGRGHGFAPGADNNAGFAPGRSRSRSSIGRLGGSGEGQGLGGAGGNGIAGAARTLMSRRGFLLGTIGAVAAAVGGVALGASQCSKKEAVSQDARIAVGDLSVLNVPEDLVFTTEGCEYIEDGASCMRVLTKAELPFGTMIWANDDNVAACLLPCETSNPLTQVGLLDLERGNVATVLEKAIGQGEGYEIYDVRANSNGAVWIEADIMGGRWRIYSASLDGLGIADPKMVAQGDGSFYTPSLAVSGSYAFWQMLPNPDGGHADEGSCLMRVPFGGGEEDATAVLKSTGGMACAPSAASGGVVVAPRADAPGTYYELTYIDAETGQVADTLVLPSQMRPTYASYGDTGFSFAFDSIYSHGGGISNLGTYTAVSSDLANDTPWFRFPRSPLADPAWNNGWLVVKSTGVVAAVDLQGRRYFTLAPEVAVQGYGEFLASSGNVPKIVTYSNVDHMPLSGEKITKCIARVWEVS